MPVSSLPSPYGIGTLGAEARKFAGFLAAGGQSCWQMLPVGPTGFGDSPYQSFSSFAGNPYFIDLDQLAEEGLLEPHEFQSLNWGDNPERVDYGRLYSTRYPVLRKACGRLLAQERPGFSAFCQEQSAWLEDYALFMAAKDAHEGRCWLEWEPELKDPDDASRKKWEKKLAEEIRYYQFLQFLFFRQWNALKEYANARSIEIIGDIPIFVSLDSVDVWAHKDLFQLDTKGYPTCVAGVPPDYFSTTGQLWGNPLYDWKAHKKEDYAWWVARVKHQIALTDYLRIDHFRGFEAYWAVPAGEETAVNGEWVKGPNEELFLAIQKELGKDLPIFAEDLGVITPEVEWLRDMFHFPGMRILQFAFEGLGESDYLPHNYTTTNCICYTGTHDNDTTAGWYANIPEECRDKIRRYGNTDGGCISLDFIRFCMGSIAKYAIFPIQDLLQLGSEARMNTPGVAADNWAFRYETHDLTPDRASWLFQTTKLFGR